MSVQQLQPATDSSYNNHGPLMYAQQASQAQASRASQTQPGTYLAAGASQNDIGLQSMIGSFAQAHISAPNGTIPAASNTIPGVNTPQYFFSQDGQIFCMPSANIFSTQPVATAHLQDGSYAAYAPGLTYATQTGYSGYMPGYAMMPYAQARQGHLSDRQGAMHKDVPGLDNRRGSYSTNESAPGTPFYGSLGHGDHGTVIATVDRSPIYSTPSPQIPHNVNVPQAGKPLPYKAIPVNYNVATHDEIIPEAIAAVFTPNESKRSLEQSLSNPIYGNRNVYIRGLHPDTNDETLAAYANIFGRVETSKAIIDTGTGTCKGFGFAKYFDVRDSENCIRGFFVKGYEVGFARESFNSRLKAKGDHSSTNLYVSNLPKTMNEMELAATFMDYNVVSSRILHDSQGNSRGVGFARFESREICEEIIRVYHGTAVGQEGLLMQVRYADTPAQKDLKKITTERRQFRTTEYNVSAYGSPVDIANLSPPMASAGVTCMAQISGHLPQLKSAGSWKRHGSSDNNGSSDGTSAPGSAFKDLDSRVTQATLTPRKQEGSKQHDERSTPTVSDDDSADEGATINCLSPVRV
ncbi:hypothetical protein VC83_06801 [Pseudogymnoascus destructans]|uniref:RRM domain-containing protein n=2 Tax=Pseudogymnoascus destructans TaxID=655981 RepID=L8GCL3_PSED2|nr:uncharacterized protein VC83_06801 [Pseudogymnoascus destructans]ELR09796.1 hypothetical protein GMDG_04279 [Pseudogymnoascus destructans 20631-21]OAF56317.2 hypothetical protein VC83_06801 [Pseudogymnoascus destructans]